VIDCINNKCKLCVTSLTGWKQKIRSLIPIFKDLKFEHIGKITRKQILSRRKLYWPRKEEFYIPNGRMARRAPHYLCAFFPEMYGPGRDVDNYYILFLTLFLFILGEI